MRLIIKRDQHNVKGFFGGDKGMTFQLGCRVELTPEEHELATKYRIKGMTLAVAKQRPDKEVSAYDRINVNTLLDGVSYTCRDVDHLLETEGDIKKACENFKLYLTVLATFGGEEVIEFADPRIELQRERQGAEILSAQQVFVPTATPTVAAL